MMAYKQPTIKQYERRAVLSFTKNDKTYTVDDSERQECENWTRIMGYFRPISDYNPGKRSEFDERVWFKIPEEAK